MKEKSLQQHILDYLKQNAGQWHKKVSLYMFADELGYSPETVGRELRDLAESGKIKVEYYNGKYSKNLAKYSYNPVVVQRKFEIIEKDGQRIAVYT